MTLFANCEVRGRANRIGCVICRVYQFKFIVDGEWQVSPHFARIYDPQGNLNNVLYVEEIGKVEVSIISFILY